MAKTTELELAIKIAGKVDPSLQAAISQAQKQVSTLSATLGHIGRVGLAVMGVGLAATVKGIADCTKEAEKFESQMAPVIRYVDGLVERGEFAHLPGLLYFTDGYGVFPDVPPAYGGLRDAPVPV